MTPPRDDVVHDTSPRPPEAGQDLTRCGLSPAPPFKGTWFHAIATIPHQRRSPPAGCFAVSSHTVAFGGIRFCSLLAHCHFWRHSPLYSIPAHGRFWQRPPPSSQPSRAPLRRLLAHDRLWQLSPCYSLLAHPFPGLPYMIACGSFRLFTIFAYTPSQAFRTRLLVAAFAFSQASRAPHCRLLTQDHMWQASAFHRLLAHSLAGFSHTIARGSFAFPQSSRAPLRRLLTHDRFWQLSPFHSLLAYPFAGFSHMIACGSFRLSTVSSCTPSQASYT